VINARYFDGKTSRLHQVQFRVDDGTAYVTGDMSRVVPLRDLQISDRMRHAPRRITFPDGAYLECSDQGELDALFSASGVTDTLVVRLQRNWRGVALAATLIVGIVVLSYLYLLPWSATMIARNLPAGVEASIGDGALEFLDKNFFSPSKLPLERQRNIQASFTELSATHNSELPIALVFRSSKIGANAFALPSRQIVLTDELVNLLNNNDELMAVLGHELGHIEEHHFTRRIIQSSAIAAGTALLFGDVSNVIAGVPTVLLDLKYSRDTESDADAFAVHLLIKNGMSPDNLAQVFEKLSRQQKGVEPVPYLSRHPLTQERLSNIRKFALAPDAH